MDDKIKSGAIIESDGTVKFTEYGQKSHRIDILNQMDIGIDITIDTLSKINLLLIPIKIEGKYGFIDKDANLIIKTLFDKYRGNFESENSLIRVCLDGKWGVINTKGNFIIPAEYSSMFISDDNKLFTVTKEYKTGVIDIKNNIVVDFGEYCYIDGYDSGLTRVKIKDKWGIIDSEGEIVLAIEFDNIWNFYKKNRRNTLVEKNGHKQSVLFSDLYRPNDYSRSNNHISDYKDYHKSVYDYPEYDDRLDIDQQSIEFWNNF